jgi:hypothetical protein
MGFPFPITPSGLTPKIALLDGYSAAHYAQKLPHSWVKGFVVLVGFAMTIVFFWRGYR